MLCSTGLTSRPYDTWLKGAMILQKQNVQQIIQNIFLEKNTLYMK